MAAYQKLPYVSTPRPRNLRLADLYLRSGEQQAEAERRRGDIQAQLWGTVGQAVGQTASAMIQAPGIAREQQAKAAQEAQRAELGSLQLGEAKRVVNDRENLDLAMREGGGVEARTVALLKDRPELAEQARGYFKRQKDRMDGMLKDGAEQIRQFGYSAEAASAAVDHFEELGFDQRTVGQFRQAFQNPDQIRTVVDRILNPDAKPESDYTLTPGDQRFRGGTHQPVASVPANATRAPNPTEASLAMAAAAGDPQALKALAVMREQRPPSREPRDPVEPLVAIMGPDGQPVLVPRSQATGQRPASNREQGRAVTSGDAGEIAEFTTALDDIATVRETLKGAKATGAVARLGAGVWNPISEATGWGIEAKQKQAVIDRVKQVIGKALEGGVLRKEDELKYTKILPTIGDPPELVTTKLDGLERAIQQRISRKVDALTDAGYDTGKFSGRTPTTGITVTTPDGQTFTFPDQGRAEAFKKRAGIK